MYGSRKIRIGIITLALACALTTSCSKKSTTVSTTESAAPIRVYCAAGIRLPVEEAAKQYQVEFGKQIEIDYGSSGELEGRLEIDRQAGKKRCDLYVPADWSFAQRAREKGLTQEQIDLATFRLVLGVRPEITATWTTVDEFLQSGSQYVICDPKAGAGKTTMMTLREFGKWEAVDAGKKAAFPRVTEAANAVKTSSDVAAGFVWNTTAKQFGLQQLELAELAGAVSTISVNLVASSTRPSDALHFARYLAAKDKGQAAFEKHHFQPIGTDEWADQPEIVLYCGGVNRNAIEKTLREFEQREGIVIKEQFAGCGTLVTGIRSAADGSHKQGMPDAFMTCDVSYMDKVQDLFLQPIDVSSTDVVMVVRKGNPKKINALRDLAQPNLTIGTTNPKMSTLGDLSWQLFDIAGIKHAIEEQNSVGVMTPTAHELIMQMNGHSKLDVALVYEANCQNLASDFEIIPVGLPEAKAVQNIAAANSSKYPALSQRLLRTITSGVSQKRFELQGFRWQVPTATP